MKVTVEKTNLDFPFKKYCSHITRVVPKEDLVGISEIRFIQGFSYPKSDPDSLGYYLQGEKGHNASIEINMPNVLEQKIPESNFSLYPEVAALLLSQIIFHEIGHHVHTFKRHGIKKTKAEDFAGQYAEACYYRYIISRKPKILGSYKWGSWNFFRMDKGGRAKARQSRKDIISWLEKNKEGIPFP